jgi:hypothetical protein
VEISADHVIDSLKRQIADLALIVAIRDAEIAALKRQPGEPVGVIEQLEKAPQDGKDPAPPQGKLAGAYSSSIELKEA